MTFVRMAVSWHAGGVVGAGGIGFIVLGTDNAAALEPAALVLTIHLRFGKALERPSARVYHP